MKDSKKLIKGLKAEIANLRMQNKNLSDIVFSGIASYQHEILYLRNFIMEKGYKISDDKIHDWWALLPNKRRKKK